MCTIASQLRISFVLVIFFASFSLIKCAPTVSYRYDDFDWKPLTWEPVTWKPFTWKPFTWKPVTWKPIKWEKPTSTSGTGYNKKLLIALPVVILVILLIGCKRYFCSESSSTDVSSNRTLHAPPRNATNAATSGTEFPGVHRPPSSNRAEGTQPAFNPLTTDYFSNYNRRNFGQNSYNNPRNDSILPTFDRPPDYEDVVSNGLWEPESKYPTTNPKPAEIPPPDYNPEHIPKF